MTPLRAVLLDRDGVLNVNRPDHVRCSAEWEWLPGAQDACRRMNSAGLQLAVVTNQAGVGRGLIDELRLQDIHAHMHAGLDAAGARVASVHYCPHTADTGCACRKPRPGLLVEALQSLGVHPSEAAMVGDHDSDLRAAAATGVVSVHVRTGRGEVPTTLLPGYLGSVADLGEAASLLIPLTQDSLT